MTRTMAGYFLEREMKKQGKLEVVKAKKEKEIGMPKNAPKAAMKMDEKMDKAKGVKEGSRADIKADKVIVKKFKKK